MTPTITHTLVECEAPVELHVKTDIEPSHGRYWRRCSCTAISPGFEYEESAESWLCPNEVADALIEGYTVRERAYAARKVESARREWEQAQQNDPRR